MSAWRWSLAHLSLIDATPPQLVSAAGAAGFRRVGLRLHPARPGEAPHPMHEGSPMLAETRARMAGLGVAVHDVEVIRLNPGFDAARLEPLLAVAASLGARYLVVNGDDDDAARSAAHLAALAERAAPYGLALGLEFMVYTAVPTLVAACALVRRAAQPNVRVLLDALHAARSGAQPAALADCAELARDFAQLNDAPAARHPAMSPGEEGRAHRLLPGEGALPLAPMAAVLAPDAVLSVEAPSALRRHHLGLDARAALAWQAAQRWEHLYRNRDEH